MWATKEGLQVVYLPSTVLPINFYQLDGSLWIWMRSAGVARKTERDFLLPEGVALGRPRTVHNTCPVTVEGRTWSHLQSEGHLGGCWSWVWTQLDLWERCDGVGGQRDGQSRQQRRSSGFPVCIKIFMIHFSHKCHVCGTKGDERCCNVVRCSKERWALSQ